MTDDAPRKPRTPRASKAKPAAPAPAEPAPAELADTEHGWTIPEQDNFWTEAPAAGLLGALGETLDEAAFREAGLDEADEAPRAAETPSAQIPSAQIPSAQNLLVSPTALRPAPRSGASRAVSDLPPALRGASAADAAPGTADGGAAARLAQLDALMGRLGGNGGPATEPVKTAAPASPAPAAPMPVAPMPAALSTDPAPDAAPEAARPVRGTLMAMGRAPGEPAPLPEEGAQIHREQGERVPTESTPTESVPDETPVPDHGLGVLGLVALGPEEPTEAERWMVLSSVQLVALSKALGPGLQPGGSARRGLSVVGQGEREGERGHARCEVRQRLMVRGGQAYVQWRAVWDAPWGEFSLPLGRASLPAEDAGIPEAQATGTGATEAQDPQVSAELAAALHEAAWKASVEVLERQHPGLFAINFLTLDRAPVEAEGDFQAWLRSAPDAPHPDAPWSGGLLLSGCRPAGMLGYWNGQAWRVPLVLEAEARSRVEAWTPPLVPAAPTRPSPARPGWR